MSKFWLFWKLLKVKETIRNWSLKQELNKRSKYLGSLSGKILQTLPELDNRQAQKARPRKQENDDNA